MPVPHRDADGLAGAVWCDLLLLDRCHSRMTRPRKCPVMVPVAKLLDGQSAPHGGSRCYQSVYPDQAGLLRSGRFTALEAEPAKPQKGSAQHDEGQVGFATPTDTSQ
jgi:hypothetical protein